MKEITLKHITDLCKDFGVAFNISYNGYVTYHFGDKISWGLTHEEFTWDDYINVIKLLSATYPEKVIK